VCFQEQESIISTILYSRGNFKLTPGRLYTGCLSTKAFDRNSFSCLGIRTWTSTAWHHAQTFEAHTLKERMHQCHQIILRPTSAAFCGATRLSTAGRMQGTVTAEACPWKGWSCRSETGHSLPRYLNRASLSPAYHANYFRYT
jgi:hypothetical protein